MLKKLSRLRGPELKTIFEKGEFFKNRSLIIRSKSNNQQSNRFAVVVSNKVVKGAVKRNKLRRQTYNILKSHLSHTNQESHKDIIIIYRNHQQTTNFTDIKDYLDKTILDLLVIKNG